jgi:hypothetical protein
MHAVSAAILLLAGLCLAGIVTIVAFDVITFRRTGTLGTSSTALQLSADDIFAVVNDTVVDDTACDDSDPCTVNVLHQQLGYCTYPAAKIGTACTSACYVDETSTTCNGLGACGNSDVTACKGYCRQDLSGNGVYDDVDLTCVAELFPLSAYFTADGDDAFDQVILSGDWGSDGDGLYCFASSCSMVVIELRMLVTTSHDDSLPFIGLPLPCHDLLDDTQETVDVSCITATEYLLDTEFIDDFINKTMNINSAQLNWARACMFQYACAPLNTTVFNDPAVLVTKRRALAADSRVKTQPVVATFVEHAVHRALAKVADREEGKKKKSIVVV